LFLIRKVKKFNSKNKLKISAPVKQEEIKESSNESFNDAKFSSKRKRVNDESSNYQSKSNLSLKNIKRYYETNNSHSHSRYLFKSIIYFLF